MQRSRPNTLQIRSMVEGRKGGAIASDVDIRVPSILKVDHLAAAGADRPSPVACTVNRIVPDMTIGRRNARSARQARPDEVEATIPGIAFEREHYLTAYPSEEAR